MRIVIFVLVIVLAGYAWFVTIPQAKCARMAEIGQAEYHFSAIRGCQLIHGDMIWLMTPGYLRTYDYQTTEQMWQWAP